MCIAGQRARNGWYLATRRGQVGNLSTIEAYGHAELYDVQEKAIN
jgi:hypothetical protein